MITKSKIISEVRKVEIDELVSLSLMGSFLYKNKFDNVSDIDLLILVKKLTPKIFNQVILEFNKIATNLSNPRVKFIVESRGGPIKPKHAPANKKLIQLHVLFYELDDLRKKDFIYKTFSFDAINFNKLIIGKKLSSIKKINKIYKQGLIELFDRLIKNLDSNTAYIGSYKPKKGRMVFERERINLSDREIYNNIYYNTTIAFLNYVRFFKPKTIKNEKILLKNAKQMLPDKYVRILKESYQIDKILKKDERIKTPINVLKKDSRDFISYLRNSIK